MFSFISLTRPSLQILDKIQTGPFLISRFLVNPSNKYCCNSNYIDMKLGPVTKLDKETWQCQKNLTMSSCQQILMSL